MYVLSSARSFRSALETKGGPDFRHHSIQPLVSTVNIQVELNTCVATGLGNDAINSKDSQELRKLLFGKNTAGIKDGQLFLKLQLCYPIKLTMIYFRALVVLATTFSALASPLVQRTVAQVEADITSIGSQVTTLNNDINAFPNTGGSLINALAIHNQAGSLESAINQGTTDVKNTGAVSEADGTTILHQVQGIEPTIISALNAIAGKRAAFDGLPLGGVSALVKADLNTLNTDTTAFENALIAAAPADLKPNATAIKTALDAAFSTAIAAYASA